ncbi:Hydroxymethylglutaryl-CoA lyase [Sulfitobacter noctilucicola]|uniref:Hydroxymethylglutaryl-CoA lyase n=1 Tax=Sulfitobacter noctilucicola TaxID=1342301 RepID=A0A7W6MC94_9RHOB|nr:hydroxymethylglutaryl-CoA lyase [Sulfitobacter noctilucicola]KIN64077.1 Hydroxymethylglutaryl-CoA lyase [Sulfitobacter noctilucicola]MBB4175431.1 hydroxymethylglutaryl-CoA lyase [Sulfitobacter noctilucicola]
MSDFAEIIEVSPRDGIQNEQKILSSNTKIELIQRGIDAGLRRFEVTSFVNPKRVPQMADADEVAAALPRDTDARFIGLTLNARGFDRAVAAGLDEANFVVVASDTFNQRNQGVPTADSIAAFGQSIDAGRNKIDVGVTIAAAFGCPFEGEVPLDRLLEVVDGCMAHAPFELALADTIGVATPRDVTERVRAVRAAYPDVRLRLHLHNTRNTGIANAWAGLEAGASSLDASLGGVGGCPFAPRATGNIATEDLVYMLDRSGVRTNVSLDKAIAAAEWLEVQLEKQVPGMVMKAGGFPTGVAAS